MPPDADTTKAPDSADLTDSDSPTDSPADSPPVEVEPGIDGPPNAGDLDAALSVDVPGHVTGLIAADLDGDTRDELVVIVGGALFVVRVAGNAETAEVEPVDGATADRVDTIGHAQLVASTGGTSSLLALVPAAGSWTATTTPLPATVDYAGAVGDLSAGRDTEADVALVVGTTLVAYQGPLAPDLPEADRLFTITGWDKGPSGATNRGRIAWGDVTADGTGDLVLATSATRIDVIAGPISDGRVSEMATLSGWKVDLPTADDNGGVGVVSGFEGDPFTSVVTSPDDAVDLWYLATGHGLEHELTGTGATEVASSDGPVVAAVGTELGWWYGDAGLRQLRPDAAVPGIQAPYTFGRFGSSSPIDFAWAVGAKVFVVTAFGGRTGADVDRDGYAEPEDCDDSRADIHPGGVESPDGRDEDCDGAVDNGTLELLDVAYGGLTERLGNSLALWRDPNGDRVAWSGGAKSNSLHALSFHTGESWDILAGADTVREAGDFDGDGQMDLVASDYSWSVVFGPPDAAEEQVGWGWLVPGYALAAAGDLDEDGLDDVVYGRYLFIADDGGWTGTYERYGYVAFGGAREESINQLRVGNGPSIVLGMGPADLDADGHYDIARFADDEVEVLRGPLDPAEELAGHPVDLFLTGAFDRTVRAVAADGGKPDDLLVWNHLDDSVDLALGPWLSGTWDIDSRVTATFTGPAGSSFGQSTVVGDGWLIVGAPEADGGTGAVYGFRIDPAIETAPTFTVAGPMDGGNFGVAVFLGDDDADGVDELFVGSAGTHVLDQDGAVWVLRLP